MCLTFKKNNKQTKKPVNRFLQDDASAGLRSLQTSIEIKLCQNPSDRLYIQHTQQSYKNVGNNSKIKRKKRKKKTKKNEKKEKTIKSN